MDAEMDNATLIFKLLRNIKYNKAYIIMNKIFNSKINI